MKKFRENATILHNAAAKRKIAANLVKKESSTQLRIFNTLFTAQNSVENDEEEEENETIQKKREKEKKLESVIQARIEQREREEAETTTKEEEENANNQKNKADKSEKDLFANLSPISSTEDECEKKPRHPKIRKIILHRVQCEIKELQPWILADPLPTGSNKPDMADICLQTDYFTAPTTNKAINTEDLEITNSETQYEMDTVSAEYEKSAFEIIMEELSEEIFLDQILAIRKQDYSILQKIVIKPDSLINAKIVDFKYLKNDDSVLLLLQNDETIGAEKWSFKNLIKPKFVKVFEKLNKNNHFLTFDANNVNTVIISDKTLMCLSNFTWQTIFTMDISDLCPCSLSLTKDIFVIASTDKFNIFSFSNFKLIRTIIRSKLTDTVIQIYCHVSYIFAITETFLSMYNSVTGIHINSKKFPFNNLKRVNYGSEKLEPQFYVMENGNILAFNPIIHSTVIINPEDFANFGLFEYEFIFNSGDTVPLGFMVYKNEIFSFNFKGEISKWELLKNHRKVRSKIFNTNIENFIKSKAIDSNVFAISSLQQLSILILPD